ncbi:HD domain-containing phosphohydrolase [Streptomyces sp. TRM 70361]|uniref:HD domain-containing phosphohydrolase n=1 Tax=Streptomyces sp. TRM 70361 TaxID=3116553 RepID=UPI002E7B07C2|nr:HD domain-containing phosphohydrolase [Streptomyces sp. TRM 70361]MEE1941165.1 HD domain-containing phosphohydrolase [Streptomyces sp. TRM 70361]
MQRIRVAEVLAALSLTTDVAAGMSFEKGLRTCAVATTLAERVLGADPVTCRAVFETALLRSVGCTSFAPELSAVFGDDVALQAVLKSLDPGDETVFAAQLRAYAERSGAAGPRLARTLAETLPTLGAEAMRSGCETSRALGDGLGLLPRSLAALDDVYERWDGRGLPDGRAGEELSRVARIVHVAEQAVLAHARGGTPGAVAETARRSGGQLDPELAGAFTARAADALAPLAEPDAVAAVLGLEPEPYATVPFGSLPGLCAVLARVVDLKSRWLLGHSEHVAALAAGAGALAGLDAAAVDALRCAGLLHDLGRAGVPAQVWDRPGPLGTAELERVRMHTYWTQRILERVPALAALAPVASAHHERLDGGGYHRGTPSGSLPQAARILAAADTFAALTEPRPHRAALGADEAAALLLREAGAGGPDRHACALVIEAAGLPRPGRTLPAGLTGREVEVLRLAARGLSNREIGERLHISARTVGHHLAHVYDKTGRRTRAGVAVFAMEHRLLP